VPSSAASCKQELPELKPCMQKFFISAEPDIHLERNFAPIYADCMKKKNMKSTEEEHIVV
jgi:hypothetical protein